MFPHSANTERWGQQRSASFINWRGTSIAFRVPSCKAFCRLSKVKQVNNKRHWEHVYIIMYMYVSTCICTTTHQLIYTSTCWVSITYCCFCSSVSLGSFRAFCYKVRWYMFYIIITMYGYIYILIHVCWRGTIFKESINTHVTPSKCSLTTMCMYNIFIQISENMLF